MKKFIFYSTVAILYYLLITALVFSFSYISLINGKTYDLLWVKYIQKKLYSSGQRKIWQNDKNCSQFDVNLLYVPVIGECSFSNSEFTTKLNFDNDRRLNMIDDNIGSDEKIISILGDSVAMGWGVNNDETFSYNLQKLIEKKVINLGVSSYGTVREIKRLKLNKFYDQIDTVVIQYHLNDINENKNLDIRKTYSKNEYDKYFKGANNSLNFSIHILKNYKKSLRLLFSHLKDQIFKEKNKETYHLAEHLENLEKIINNNLDDIKEVIIFLIKEPHQNLIYDDDKRFKDFEFFIIEAKKEHFFIIDDHLNKLGHKFVGKKLFDYLDK